jgi:hypothetical protein
VCASESAVLIRVTGDIIVLSPPLIVEKAQIDRMFEYVRQSVQAVDQISHRVAEGLGVAPPAGGGHARAPRPDDQLPLAGRTRRVVQRRVLAILTPEADTASGAPYSAATSHPITHHSLADAITWPTPRPGCDQHVIHRLVRDAENHVWLIDYKTNPGEGRTGRYSWVESAHRYASHLDRYLSALPGSRAGLYFPLLKGRH